MLPGRTFTPEEIIRILLRHKWMVIVPFLVGLAASIGVASRIAEKYRSETLIMVMPQRISPEILPEFSNDQIEKRLPSISDQILSRSRLERIIADFDLYAAERARGAIMEDLIVRMRRDIDVRIDAGGKQSFRVMYENADPTMAYKVTQRLASLYIEESLKDKDNVVQTANSFLDSELETARARLIEQEKKVEAYKKQFAGQLPSEVETNQQAIASAQLQLQANAQTVNRARERRQLAQQQLVDLQSQPLAVTDPIAVPGGQATAQTAAQQLETAEESLAAAKGRYTPDHPDVRILERRVNELRAKAEAEARAPQAARASKPMTPAEAARQKRIRDLEAEIAIVDSQIASAEQEERTLKATISTYQIRLSGAPTREAELVELNRDYKTLDNAYQELLKKKQESQLAANVQQRQIGETYRIIDPATLPQRPFNQRVRLMVVAGGAMGGLVLGLALIGFGEYRDSSFKTEDDVVRVLSLPVLAQVPTMSVAPPRHTRWWHRAGATALVGAVSLGSGAVMLWRLWP